MKPTIADSHWQSFCQSGSVEEYLLYKKAISEETSNEIFHQRTDYKGTPRGGIGSAGNRTDP